MMDDLLELLQDRLPYGSVAEYDMMADMVVVDGHTLWPEASKEVRSMSLREAVGLICDALHELDSTRYLP